MYKPGQLIQAGNFFYEVSIRTAGLGEQSTGTIRTAGKVFKVKMSIYSPEYTLR